MNDIILQKLTEVNAKIDAMSLSAKEIMNLEEAMTYLRVSKSYLYKLTHRREIPFYKPSGKLIYFKKSELDQWILQNRQSSNDEVLDEVLSNLKISNDGTRN